MTIVLWIIAIVLAVFYLAAGLSKLVRPKAKLIESPQMGWAQDFSEPALKGIGAVEVLGALGLVLPWATGIAPVLTPVAAVGLALLQVGAAIVHLRRGEAKVVPMNVVLVVLAAFVAVGRF